MLDLTRRRLLGASATLLGSAALPGLAGRAFAQGKKDKVKAAFVYVGPVGDYGYTFAHDQGRKFLEQALGDKVETSFVENVAEGPDAERVIRQLAQGGNDIVFTRPSPRRSSGSTPGTTRPRRPTPPRR